MALAREKCFRPLDPDATEALLLFDCGGANAARSLRFKEDLIALSERLDVRLRIAHYPPYTSNWNPIEQRLFSQVEHRWNGVILNFPEKALRAVEKISTRSGLRVTARILDKVYELGRKCSDTFREIRDQFIRHDPVLGDWNIIVDANGVTGKYVKLFCTFTKRTLFLFAGNYIC
ncbi:MAG: hypothetical protein N838_07505 [Thiohalocapsa sp. PB-PSB1]|jgi:hypothetical protein|nr:MAG: hypothetical protein N838_07505 [Thiohalocapsa sp. PB-PSB1]